MRLFTVNAGYFKLDGGAMHGVVPKSMWNKVNPSDDNNMCSWAMRWRPDGPCGCAWRDSPANSASRDGYVKECDGPGLHGERRSSGPG